MAEDEEKKSDDEDPFWTEDEEESKPDDDEEDEEEDEEMADTRGRGDPRGGSGGGRGRDESPDFASNPKFSRRFLSNLLHIVVSNWGEKAGDTTFINSLVEKIEGLIGPSMLGGLSALASAGINNPAVVKGWLRTIGVPEDAIALSDEAIDAFINGVLNRRRRGKMSERDLEEEAGQAQKKSSEKGSETITLAQGIAMLNVADQKKFRDNYKALDDDSRKLFETCRGRIRLTRQEMKNFLAALCDDTTNWSDQLRMMYGEVKPATAAVSDAITGVVKTMVGVVKDLDATVVKAVAPPATGSDPVVQDIRRMRKWLKTRR